jgi:plastocyanin
VSVNAAADATGVTSAGRASLIPPEERDGMRGRCWAAAAIAAAGMACSGRTATTPTPIPINQPVATMTITIANNVATPQDIVVAVGSRVTFVNNDTIPHDMHSDPHPEHTDCEPLNQVGFLNPGESRESGNLNTPKICGFHDHELPNVAGLNGTITIK